MGKLERRSPACSRSCGPYPVLEITTGATNQNQGQYAFSVSGINPERCTRPPAKLMAKLAEYPGFATISSGLLQQHAEPRHRASGATRRRCTASPRRRILSLLRTAYSQNYVYLIKKPQDQYQVILEVEDSARAHPEDLSRLYIRSRRRQEPRPAEGAGRPGRRRSARRR